MVGAYALTQALGDSKDFIAMLYAVQSFVNEQLYEECAPLATFESACKVVRFEFEENFITNDKTIDAMAELAQSNARLKKLIDAAQS